jgi:predicted pyridoxine 5'-phosphate oxidase superfamily flavin-nucleotide-binding protein
MTFKIDDSLKEFIESAVAVVVGTGDDNGRPHVTGGWGPRVLDDRSTIDLFLDTERATLTLRDLQANGRIAMTIADPVSYRSAQFKGKLQYSRELTEDDHDWVRKHREGFAAAIAIIGDPNAVIRTLWMDEITHIAFAVERAFDQTPGPDAGRPL